MKGLYIHIPFCNQKCPYCDFFSITKWKVSFESYFEALLKELEYYASLYTLNIKTIYFGGGTPSVVPPKVYKDFLSRLGSILDLSKVEEITIEVNPESYGLEEFIQLREIGFNRVSVGVQSFLEENLKKLGRKHSVKHSLETIKNLSRAEFENISVDLIWGLPQQTPQQLREEFKYLSDLGVVHLSAYLLTVYEETPLYRWVEEGKFNLPYEEQIEALYYTLLEETKKLGFQRYEISNFAKEEKYRSKHNLLYWKMEPFLGIGAGAWSFDSKKRWFNKRNLLTYIEAWNKSSPPVEEVIDLSEEELLRETLIMGLRTTEGVNKELVLKKNLPKEIIEEFFTFKGDKIAFNDRGFLLSNSILSMLI